MPVFVKRSNKGATSSGNTHSTDSRAAPYCTIGKVVVYSYRTKSASPTEVQHERKRKTVICGGQEDRRPAQAKRIDSTYACRQDLHFRQKSFQMGDGQSVARSRISACDLHGARGGYNLFYGGRGRKRRDFRCAKDRKIQVKHAQMAEFGIGVRRIAALCVCRRSGISSDRASRAF